MDFLWGCKSCLGGKEVFVIEDLEVIQRKYEEEKKKCLLK